VNEFSREVNHTADSDLIFTSAVRLAKLIREKHVSSTEVVKAYITRIKQVNPRLNAVVQLAEERATLEAKRADDLLARGKDTGPLHGVPVTIKDSFDSEGVISAGGTIGRKDFVPARDAEVVARLRHAGAILLGKTNTSEMTIGSDVTNAVYGGTRNPYNLDWSPSGSSGGPAAAIASGCSALEIGSDTGGSIREPAHVCGIAALKPTAGRVPRTGHIIPPGLGALDDITQVGPMARFVEDLILTLPIISGVDRADPAAIGMPLGDPANVDLSKLKVAFFTRIEDLVPSEEIEKTLKATAEALAQTGVQIRERSPKALAGAGTLYARLRNADGGAHLRRLLEKAGTTQPGPAIVKRLAGLKPVGGEEFSLLLEEIDEYRREMLHFMEDFDAIICPPALRTAWRQDAVFDNPYKLWAFLTSSNLTGWPAAVVRAGTTAEGAPIGVQIIGAPWREDVVLALALRVETLMGGYQRPGL